MWRSTCGVIVLAASDGHAAAARGGVLGEAALERVAGQRAAGAGREQRVVGPAVAFASQARMTVTVCLVSGVMRCLRPLPMAADVRAGAEAQVAAGQADQLAGA